jgi:hypothetical protein
MRNLVVFGAWTYRSFRSRLLGLPGGPFFEIRYSHWRVKYLVPYYPYYILI